MPIAKPLITPDRILANGFYLADLRAELALIRKSRKCQRDLRGRLRDAILADAIWPSSGPARIALILHLIENPTLLDLGVRWRHPHEQRTAFGKTVKRSGLWMRAAGAAPR